jgi:hypothetical protein
MSNPSNNDEDSQLDTTDAPQLFNQFELNYLVRDLDRTNKAAEILGSRFKEKNVLAKGLLFIGTEIMKWNSNNYFQKKDHLYFVIIFLD